MQHPSKVKILVVLMAMCMATAFATTAYAAEGSGNDAFALRASSGDLLEGAIKAPLDFTVENPPAQGDGWTWDAAAKTLTLDGCTLDSAGDYDAAVVLPDGAKVVAKDHESTIKVAGGAGSTPRVAIYSEGAFAISSEGGAMLKIEATEGANGIEAAGVGFAGAYVTISAGWGEQTGTGAAVHTTGTVSIDKSQVTVIAGGDRMGLYIEADEDCIANHEALTATYDKDTFLDVETASAPAVLIQASRLYGVFEVADPVSFEDHIGPMIGGRESSADNGDLYTSWSFAEAQTEWEYVEGIPVKTATHVRIAELHALEVAADAAKITVHKDDTEQAFQFLTYVFPNGAVDNSLSVAIDREDLVSLEQDTDAQGRQRFTVRPKGTTGTAMITITSADTTLSVDDRPSTTVEIEITDTYVTVGNQAITDDYTSGDGKVAFDASTNTLTLDGAILDAANDEVGSSKAEVFYEDREIAVVEVTALVAYCRKTPLTIKVKGDVTIKSKNQYSAGIAVAPYLVGISPTDNSVFTKTGIVNIEGEDGASINFEDCRFADIVLSCNMWPNDIDGTNNLLIANLSIKAVDEGAFGICSGRETGLYDTTLEVANKQNSGILTGNMLTMSNCDISVHDIVDNGIYAAGNGFNCMNGTKLSIKEVGGYGASAPSYAIIRGGEIEVDGCGQYAVGAQYLWIYNGSVKVTNAEFGLLGMSASTIYDGTVEVNSKYSGLDVGFLQLLGGNVKLVTETGFAVRTTGQMGILPGLVVEGGTLDAKTTGHAAVLGGCGCTLGDEVMIDTPEGGKVLEVGYGETKVATIAAADTESIYPVWDQDDSLDIEGGAEHVVICVNPVLLVDRAIVALPEAPAADATAEEAAAYKAAVASVLEAYDALTDEQKASVSELQALLAAQRAVAARDAADAEAAAAQAAADLLAAQKAADESAAKATQLEKDLQAAEASAAKQVKLAKPVLTKKTKSAKKGKVTVAWKKVKDAQGYEVKVGSKTYTVKKATTLKKTVKAKKGKKVKVQVRAFKKQGTNTLYGPWSKAKKVKVKK